MRVYIGMEAIMFASWKLFRGNSLQARVLNVVVFGSVLNFAILGTLGYLAVRQSVDRSLEERLVLSKSTAAYLEEVLEQNLRRLADFGNPDLSYNDTDSATLRTALRDLYFRSIFDDSVFLLDTKGNLIMSEPQGASRQEDLQGLMELQQSLQEKRLTVSSVHYREPGHRPLVSAIAPVRDNTGRLVGWVGGSIDLTGSSLTSIIAPTSLGKTGYVEVVDATGTVLASTRAEYQLTQSDHAGVLADLIAKKTSAVRTCHSCHSAEGTSKRETEILAFVPLSTIPWGVGIRQSEAEALAPVRVLRDRFIIFGVLLLSLNVALAFGIGRGVVYPLQKLTKSARNLASGDLSQPVPTLGKDEVGVLGTSLELMRVRLRESIYTISKWNSELEARIAERTSKLKESQADRERLLQRFISAQEEERKRVARELHDEVSQNIAMLAMALERATSQEKPSDPGYQERLSELHGLALKTLEDVRRVIFDLRPAILDDLGLGPALKWYAQNRLEKQGIKVLYEIPSEGKRLSPPVEVALFRVAQEAITNVARHSEAQNVIIELETAEDAVELRVEDDGKGFDMISTLQPGNRKTSLGILGMQERIAALKGEMTIDSHPGEGTIVSVRIPLADQGIESHA